MDHGYICVVFQFNLQINLKNMRKVCSTGSGTTSPWDRGSPCPGLWPQVILGYQITCKLELLSFVMIDPFASHIAIEFLILYMLAVIFVVCCARSGKIPQTISIFVHYVCCLIW